MRWVLLAFAVPAVQAATVVESTGESAITGDDVPTARLEAIARARWDAVERVAGVETKSSSFVNDYVLLDESVIQRTSGVITESTVLAESRHGDTYTRADSSNGWRGLSAQRDEQGREQSSDRGVPADDRP